MPLRFVTSKQPLRKELPCHAAPPHFCPTLTGLNGLFHVHSFSGRERPSQPYAFELVLLSEQADLDMAALLHQPVFVTVNPDGTGVHGHVYGISQGPATAHGTPYTLTLVPRLAYLEHRTNQRVFQQRTVRHIIARLLKEHGMAEGDVEFRLSNVHRTRTYCVQYHETDLHFVQRLCEEEGLNYHFEHSVHGHRLVFEDGRRVSVKHSRPCISGVQVAHVIGHGQGATRCDRHGRIKVRFHWHHASQKDAQRCCWLPLAAGIGLPHEGMDVLVTFLDGNPDRPLIAGYLPVALGAPTVEFHTVLRRRSTAHGTVLNEVFLASDKPGGDEPPVDYLKAG